MFSDRLLATSRISWTSPIEAQPQRANVNENPQRCVICCADLQNRRSATGAFKGLVGGPSGPMRRPARATSSHLPAHCASIGVSVGTLSTPLSAARGDGRDQNRQRSDEGKAMAVVVEG